MTHVFVFVTLLVIAVCDNRSEKTTTTTKYIFISILKYILNVSIETFEQS